MPGHTVCGAATPYCVNTKLDPNNCGACGAACIHGFGRCIDGQCPSNTTCAPGLMGCFGGPNNEVEYTCVDIKTDRNHCGFCQAWCPEGQGCQDGQCVPDPNAPPRAPWDSCDDPLKWCGDHYGNGDGCVNFKNDNRNCGRCQVMVSAQQERG